MFAPGDQQYEVELEIDPAAHDDYREAVQRIFDRAGIAPVAREPKAKRLFDRILRS